MYFKKIIFLCINYSYICICIKCALTQTQIHTQREGQSDGRREEGGRKGERGRERGRWICFSQRLDSIMEYKETMSIIIILWWKALK